MYAEHTQGDTKIGGGGDNSVELQELVVWVPGDVLFSFKSVQLVLDNIPVVGTVHDDSIVEQVSVSPLSAGGSVKIIQA